MKDEELRRKWLELFPIGTNVEVHLGRRGWVPAKVTDHVIEPMTVQLKVLSDAPAPTIYYILYGNRSAIRRR